MRKSILIIGLVFLAVLLSLYASDSIRLKVIIDEAAIYAKPEIGSNVQAKVALGTLLDAEVKEGLWYKVSMESEGVTISGYIHEMLVEPAGDVSIDSETDVSAPAEIKTQGEILAGIEMRLEENKSSIRAKEELISALEALQPLIAKTFRIEDSRRQRQLATEIYLWRGLAYAGMNDHYSAFIEFRNMFEVDDVFAKEISRNILENEIASLILQAEKMYKGLITEYSLEISTEPKEALIRIDGVDIGLSPEVYRSALPKLLLEIEKRGYKPVKEEIFLSNANVKKEYVLEKAGRDLQVISNPPGARVFLDGEDTGETTECTLPFVTFGSHSLRLEKDFHASWEKNIEVVPGDLPQVAQADLPANVYSFFQKWGGSESNLFKEPAGLAIDQEDFIYVLDLSSTKLKKFNQNGKLVKAVGINERDLRELKEPAGLAVDRAGNIYVTDQRKHAVYKFDKNGSFLLKWGQEGNQLQDLQNPSGIAVSNQDHIYVVDTGNSRIKVFSSEGTLMRSWGARGDADGYFISPTAVAVSGRGDVYVGDRFRVQRFSSEGEFISSWGSFGNEESQFNKPNSIAIDTRGYVYVSDSENHRIQKFDPSGAFIAQWGVQGSGDGQMTLPTNLIVDSKGHVFVLEKMNNRVQVFHVPPQID